MKMAQMLVLDDSFEVLLASLKKAINDENFESALSINSEFKLKFAQELSDNYASSEAGRFSELLLKHQTLISNVETSRLTLQKEIAKFNKNKINVKKYQNASK